MARNTMRKPTKSRLLGLASSRRKLNSSKTVDEVTYYSLADMESVIAAVLNQVSEDPSVGITLEAGDNGVILNCINDAGDEFTIDVDLESEDGAVAETDAVVEDAVVEEVNASRRRRMNSARRRMNASKSRKRLNSSKRYFAVPVTDHRLMAKIEDDDATDAEIVADMEEKGYEIDGADMKSYSPDKFCTLTWTSDEFGGYLEG